MNEWMRIRSSRLNWKRFVIHAWNVHQEYSGYMVCVICEIQFKTNNVCVFSYRTEKDMGPRSPYLTVHSDGYIGTADDKVLISTCRMRIFKFPFDIQSCNLTFKSVSHTGEPVCLSLHMPYVPSLLTCKKLTLLFVISHLRWRNTSFAAFELWTYHNDEWSFDSDPVRVALH